ncbi:S1/P1 nuclease [Ferruginibacter lapsinanis]|uniref:S1/P1 nuclease n=1 Tax=Ferruginibacter lapsinanis TaxID=563172 RepID=UPI001E5F54DF|nr:S1/P1 nuclease [Ferruginibacter lapsinanis]UEG48576.1 S1/P1 nuclease [Ferruginibacter lapsinanis]
MKKSLFLAVFAALVFTIPNKSYAWGAKGHSLVAEIAFHFLDDSTKAIVGKYLGNLSIEEAATWMDDSKGNTYYEFMRSWHYFDIDKGAPIKVTPDRNMLTVIYTSLMELEKKDNLKKKDINVRLKYLFHLIGDLHQPLHCGYSSDKGGNAISIHSPFVSGNLHSVWDTQIIDYAPVDLEDCLKLYDSLSADEIKAIRKIDVLGWYKQSRSYLDTAYNFKDGLLDKPYLDNMTPIITKQLLRGGLRLASVLKSIFNPDKNETVVNFGFDDYFDYYNYVAIPKPEKALPYPFMIGHGDDCF